MHRLRAVKSKQEIELLQQACAITRAGFLRVCRFVRPGVTETEVEAEFAHEFIRRGGSFAYPPIIAAGKNACVLHYVDNDQICRKGELLLLDVAAGYANYNADLTRTIPVNGRFTRRQRQVYNAVLRVLRAVIQAATPGQVPQGNGRRRPRRFDRKGTGGPWPAEAGGDPEAGPGQARPQEVFHARRRPPARAGRA